MSKFLEMAEAGDVKSLLSTVDGVDWTGDNIEKCGDLCDEFLKDYLTSREWRVLEYFACADEDSVFDDEYENWFAIHTAYALRMKALRSLREKLAEKEGRDDLDSWFFEFVDLYEGNIDESDALDIADGLIVNNSL